ncbi:MAG: chorismate-binding protein [Bacteroidia bacterium]|nr:chorismate-binding protein [Bacteroidia bacterium]
MKLETTKFFKKINASLEAKRPFVAYNYPNSKEIKGFFQLDDTLHSRINFEDSGFIFAPFDDKNKAILIPSNSSEIFETNLSEVSFPKILVNEKFLNESLKEKEIHLKLVQKGIKFLHESDCKKVVLSRKMSFNYTNIKPLDIFKKLLKLYENAMVYIWFHPKIGLWLGATPETLLKVDKDQFSTVALAGTQEYHGSLDVVWLQKEIAEQQFVTDFILEKFKDTSSVTVVSKPRTIRAGNIMHLCTTISGKLSNQLRLTNLLKELHPTPAVCGVPKRSSKEFILANEGYDRSFYTGFLGELNMNDSSNLYVNLRCMQVEDDKINIFVGGGITLDSIDENEWEETVAKSKVMMAVLGKALT